jgi:hypothetical protein
MKKFKIIILIIVLFLLAMISISQAGIDQMETRQPGQPPVEQSDNPGTGGGGGVGNNPNVPIDDYLPALIFLTLLYGIYNLRKTPVKEQ